MLLPAVVMVALLQISAAVVAQELQPYTEKLSGTLVEFQMVPVPGGTYEMANPEEEGATLTSELKGFWIGKVEVTWDEYDVYMYRLDQEDKGGSEAQGSGGPEPEGEPTTPEAVARPTKPYGAPDLGFGHQGYAALHITYHAAQSYCKWLSLKTGKKYRLPTEAEWEYACRAGVLPAGPIEDAALLDRIAWYEANADEQTHPVGSKEPNAWGIHDMLGNTGEWCQGIGKKPVVRGGSFQDPAEEVHPGARKYETPDWTMSDPQIPKSKWWLADAPFAGFRVVCEP
jgi:formylglycine-generating enzyme required for sulfatase activity